MGSRAALRRSRITTACRIVLSDPRRGLVTRAALPPARCFHYAGGVDLADAYRVLELAPGASRDEAREARIVLAKVWHPDRHQGDPKVYERADRKLRQINEAFATLETAGFPKVELPQREARARERGRPGHFYKVNREGKQLAAAVHRLARKRPEHAGVLPA